MQELLNRSACKREDCWNLEDIYAQEEVWQEDFDKLKSMLTALEQLAGHLTDSKQALLDALSMYFSAAYLAEKLVVYAHMRRDEDNANSRYQQMTDRAMSLSNELSGAVSFFEPELLQASSTFIHQVLEDNAFHPYKRYIVEIMRHRPHVLDKEREKLLAMTMDMADTVKSTFTMLNNADIRFPTIKDTSGTPVEITHGRYGLLMENPDRRVRKEAFEGLYQSYGSLINTIGSLYAGQIKSEIFYAKARNFESTRQASLFQDEIELVVYDRLVDVIEQYTPVLHRYVAVRKQCLRLDEIHMYDLHVPIVEELDIHIPFEKALELVVQAVKPLGEEYGKIIAKAGQEGWIDRYENRGKTSGAYSWGVYGFHPCVLLNYQPRIDDVFTIAHELGHAMHSYLSDQALPFELAGYPIVLAEVASTLNEILLLDYLLQKMPGNKEKRYLLNHLLESIRTTFFRQTMFASFEKQAHQMAESGQSLSIEALNALYRSLNIQYYGPEMVVDAQIDMEWARIPHFYTPFYVYKYATGFSSAVCLAENLRQEGKSALERTIGLLSGGGSLPPLEQLQKAGVDLTSHVPVNACMKLFERTLDEFEALL